MGNSEVGHLHLGCGRILNQDLSRINQAIEDKTFFSNPVLCEAVDTALENGKCLRKKFYLLLLNGKSLSSLFS